MQDLLKGNQLANQLGFDVFGVGESEKTLYALGKAVELMEPGRNTISIYFTYSITIDFCQCNFLTEGNGPWLAVAVALLYRNLFIYQ